VRRNPILSWFVAQHCAILLLTNIKGAPIRILEQEPLEDFMIPDINRRVVLQTLGLGSATLLVGCNITTPDITDPNAIAALSTQNQTTTCPGSITLTVKTKKIENAQDAAKYTVLKVEFYRGTVLLGTVTIAPYTIKIDITPDNLVQYEDDGKPEDEEKNGYYAKVYYQNGKVQKTDKIRVKIDKTCTPGTTDTTPPTVSLATSSNTVNADGKVTLTATASDETGGSGLAKVEFLEGATLLSSVLAAPFSFDINYTQTNNGTHNYIAKAYDKAGNFAVSTPSVSVVVNIPGTPPTDTTAPTVTLSSSSLNLVAAGSITLTAGATDNAGGSGIASIELFDGSTSLGVKTAAPFTWTQAIAIADNGTKTYTAKATDKAGNVGSSPTVSVVVNIPTPDIIAPTTTLSASSTNVITAGSITVTATATDNAGGSGVKQVELFDNGVAVGTAKLVAPYVWTIAFSSTDNRTHAYTAKATDNAGNVGALSVPVNVVVNIPVPITGTKVASVANFPNVGSFVLAVDTAGNPLGGSHNRGAVIYRSGSLLAGGITINGMFFIGYDRACTHEFCDVFSGGSGTPNASHVITCPCHQASFNLETKAVTSPANGMLPVQVIKASGTDIYI
jgi:Rieske Fe-S protein